MSNQEPQPSWWEGWPRWLQVSIITAAALLFILVWWLLPPLLYAATAEEAVRVKAITDTRTALLAGLVGIGALGTFWMNNRNVKLTAKTLRVSEAHFRLAEQSQRDSLQLAERGQVTDRYTKAIEQLGNDNLDVRLGAIYALEQIAHDSLRPRDQATIVEVLSAFVRVHSDPDYQSKASVVTDAKQPPDRDEAIAYANQLPRPPVDVKAAVTVLGRPPERFEPGADLRGAYLRRIELIGANLIDADLTGAILSGANLADVDLTGATVARADLCGANLTDADLIDADLNGANLNGANLTRADLSNADLTGAVLNSADLGAAKGLAEEQLEGAVGDGDTVLPLEMRRPKSWW